MTEVLANYTADISELKQNPCELIKRAEGQAVAILHHNRPSAYLLPAELYEQMIDILEDYALTQELKKRLNDEEKPITVKLDEL
ncbi:type II toxin-antitoxin system prevent-host-death family antitoxin [Nitratifractor salsuginis]|uniref:Antitoxin n=1 Tax=Nitratifractor salsuginis (strain DSM 16511 / JCM 12458 / E9I37-1) TaxID=749222 RepID=E6X2T2_NITSE|nr:type II toxin-antitoxin system prevent-host-death family antitoxin [Nitratifractor salsuginis]ADV46148.1 prevent-host-death family protein [Nitratifractor salsuginis DSM 16511]